MAGLLAAKCRAELEVALSVGVVRARLSLLSLLSSLVGERGTKRQVGWKYSTNQFRLLFLIVRAVGGQP